MKNSKLIRSLAVLALVLAASGVGWQSQRAQAQFGGPVPSGGYSGPARAEDVSRQVAALSQKVDALSAATPAVITANGNYVYVLRGNTLSVFSVTLDLIKSVELVPATPPATAGTQGHPYGGQRPSATGADGGFRGQ